MMTTTDTEREHFMHNSWFSQACFFRF